MGQDTGSQLYYFLFFYRWLGNPRGGYLFGILEEGLSVSPVPGNVMAKPRVWSDSAERVPANLLPAPGSGVGLLGEG